MLIYEFLFAYVCAACSDVKVSDDSWKCPCRQRSGENSDVVPQQFAYLHTPINNRAHFIYYSLLMYD